MPKQAVDMKDPQSNYMISVVVPLKDEEDNVKNLYAQIKSALDSMRRPYEIIFVNDGSADETEKRLADLALQDANIHLVNFTRNYGQTAAMSAGFKLARGAIIIAMDGDLQNDPNDIPKLVAKLEEGYDLVSGWRKNRKDNVIHRTIPSKIANWLIGAITKIKLHDYGCSLKAYRADILKRVELYGEMHRFIPALVSQISSKITEVPVNHRAREHGKTKYSITRTLRVVLDLLTVKFLNTFSTRPLHIIGIPGLVAMIIGFILAAHLSIGWIFYDRGLANRPLLTLAVLLILVGVQFLTIGLLAEFLARIYYSSTHREVYQIRSEIKAKQWHGIR